MYIVHTTQGQRSRDRSIKWVCLLATVYVSFSYQIKTKQLKVLKILEIKMHKYKHILVQLFPTVNLFA